MFDFLQTIREGVKKNASDIHLASGNRPACRIDGEIRFCGGQALEAGDVEQCIKRCLDADRYERFRETGDADAAVELPGCGRFRLNAFRQNRGPALVLRVVGARTPELGELNLPESVNRILALKSGLVLVTGPTGSGKSTTLAAVINEFNKTRHCHIITVEDPIEYLHTPKNCVVSQREVGSDSASYARALRAALREDPDIILVGEMRDLESISIAVTAAETGHLVLSTLHTIGAANTIDRLVDVFPPEQQHQIRTQLSMALKSVISQRLLPARDGRGRVAAFEIMFVNNAIGNLIREGRTANLSQIIETGAAAGMITLEKSIRGLLESGAIDRSVAEEYSFSTAQSMR